MKRNEFVFRLRDVQKQKQRVMFVTAFNASVTSYLLMESNVKIRHLTGLLIEAHDTIAKQTKEIRVLKNTVQLIQNDDSIHINEVTTQKTIF